MFREVLQGIRTRTEGCVGVWIMGTDGISVEKIRPGDMGENLDIAVAEYASLVANARRVASGEMGLGKLYEATFAGESGIFILRFVNRDYFIAMVLSPEGNFGRGRYELSRAALLLEKELAV